MKQITIFGATGFVGKILTQKAIDRGFKVKVLVRNKSKLGELDGKVEIIEGTYFDKNALSHALQGSDAVLSTIGPPMNGKLSVAEEESYIKSLTYIIEQMETNKQSRWINISGAGVKSMKEELPFARKMLRVMLKMASKSTISIKEKELQLLEKSKLQWTNVRPPMIKESAKGEFVTDENKFLGMAVDVNQLSDFMLNEIDSKTWIKKAPVVGTK
jgi:putative NADH-flavin reductase